jgi:hypothetical protein
MTANFIEHMPAAGEDGVKLALGSQRPLHRRRPRCWKSGLPDNAIELQMLHA